MAIIPTSGEFTKVPEGGGSDNRFVVTLTPTAADYSGTMDKNPSEIKEAWNAGKTIFFNLVAEGVTYIAPDMRCGKSGRRQVHSTYVMMGNNLLVINTDSSDSRYTVTQYQLTPMGS